MRSNYLATSINHGSLTDGHQTRAVSLLHDSDLQLERESRARSGNYLETVAIELDNLSKTLDDELIETRLATIIDELLYLDERYGLVKRVKHRSSRQSH